jgi:hypothetical protein
MGKAGKVKTRHVVQIVYQITIVVDGSAIFHNVCKTVVVFGGKEEIQEAILKNMKYMAEGDGGGEVYEDVGDPKILKLYIDKIEQDLEDLKDLEEFKNMKMFGASLDICGFGLKV